MVEPHKVAAAKSPHQNALSSISVRYFIFMLVTWYLTDIKMCWLSAFLRETYGAFKRTRIFTEARCSSHAMRNLFWHLSTENVPMGCSSSCRSENVHLQWTVMYTRGGEEGSTCGWWPAETPDVQRCLDHVFELCCKCVVRNRLLDTHWGIWAADDGSLFPARKTHCRLLRI